MYAIGLVNGVEITVIYISTRMNDVSSQPGEQNPL
jgi:hypothetical protein